MEMIEKQMENMKIGEKMEMEKSSFFDEMSLDGIRNMLQMLSKQQILLKEEIDELKQYIKKEEIKKEEVVNKCAKSYRKCDIFFEDWINKISVNEDQLQKVFLNDLTDGIKCCLSDQIDLDGIDFIPIQLVKNKSSNFVIYSNENNEWEICSQSKLLSCIVSISHKFAKSFIQYQKETILEHDLGFEYFVKIAGTKIKKDKQCTEIKNFLLSLLTTLECSDK